MRRKLIAAIMIAAAMIGGIVYAGVNTVPAKTVTAATLTAHYKRHEYKPRREYERKHPVKPVGSPSPAPTSPAPSPAPSACTPVAAPQPIAVNEMVKAGSVNEEAWSEAILCALGAPLTVANVESMSYWQQNEAGERPWGYTAENNPIAVSEQGFGGTDYVHEAGPWYLMNYPTVQDGIAATVAYLSYPNYARIVADLKAGTGLMNDPSLAPVLAEYSGDGYTSIPDAWGKSQGTPLVP